jgi:hypothetical protein
LNLLTEVGIQAGSLLVYIGVAFWLSKTHVNVLTATIGKKDAEIDLLKYEIQSLKKSPSEVASELAIYKETLGLRIKKLETDVEQARKDGDQKALHAEKDMLETAIDYMAKLTVAEERIKELEPFKEQWESYQIRERAKQSILSSLNYLKSDPKSIKIDPNTLTSALLTYQKQKKDRE